MVSSPVPSDLLILRAFSATPVAAAAVDFGVAGFCVKLVKRRVPGSCNHFIAVSEHLIRIYIVHFTSRRQIWMHNHSLFQRPMRWILFFTLLCTATLAQCSNEEKTVLVLGDSLSAGYGIDIDQGWVSLLQNRLAETDYNYQVVNASISGETTSGGLRRLPAALEQWQPDIVIVELGGNDGLRGTPLNTIANNLAAIVELSQQAGAQTLLLEMQIPPNYGPRYTQRFKQNYTTIAEQYEIAWLPFFLANIATDPNKMQPDGIHPKANAQQEMLEQVWQGLETLL